MDYNFVTNRVATGAGIFVQSDVDDIVKAGITHIIDCRAEFDDFNLLGKHPELVYLFNGVFDDGKPKPASWFEKSINFALDALSHPKNKVYAHCAAGINRGPSTAYAILCALGLTAQVSEDLIRKARPQVGLAYKNDADSAISLLGYK